MTARASSTRLLLVQPLCVVALAVLVVSCSASNGDAPEAAPTQSGAVTPSTDPVIPSPTAAPSPEPTAQAASAVATEQDLARASEFVADMSVEQLAGAVIVGRYDGTDAPTSLVQDLHLGGVIAMGANVGDVATLRERNADLVKAANRPYPLVIAVDQEGGIVARVGAPATEFPTLMTLGAARDKALARAWGAASGEELKALGFSMVFAPVADVTIGRADPTIGSRSAGSGPKLVASLVTSLLQGYSDAGLVAVAKHFPGHGSVRADSHLTLPVQRASRATLEARDFVPFKTAQAAQMLPAVMIAHIDVKAIDPGVPASLSRPMISGVLRKDLGFDGLVITDAQDMGAITGTYGSGGAAVRALAAGADVILMPLDTKAAHAAIVAAITDKSLPMSRVEQAATRLIAAMLHAKSPQPATKVVGSHDALSADLSRAGVTLIPEGAGSCTAPLVDGSIRIVGGSETDRQRLGAAAAKAGLTVGSGVTVRLIGYGQSAGSGEIVVTLDTPFALAGSTADTAKIALYGRTPGAFTALVEVLTGTHAAPGQLPVTVKGLSSKGC